MPKNTEPATPRLGIEPDAPASASEQYMQIGEVAHRTGLTQRALRYYESVGLLQPPTRMDGGFRLYSEEDLGRLDRIVELKRLLGFSLAEIKQILDADDVLRQIRQENKAQPNPEERRPGLVRAIGIIEEQLQLVGQRIEAMHELQTRYERRLERLRGRLASLDEVPTEPEEVPEPSHTRPVIEAATHR